MTKKENSCPTNLPGCNRRTFCCVLLAGFPEMRLNTSQIRERAPDI